MVRVTGINIIENAYLAYYGVRTSQVHQRGGLKTLHRSLFTFENSAENFLGTACSTPAPQTDIIEKRDTSYEMSLISMVRVTGVEPAACLW